MQSFQFLEPFGFMEHAQAIAQQGFELRGRLRNWAYAHHTSTIFRHSRISQVLSTGSIPEREHQTNQTNLLAETFFSATSIYLSGVFDYEICQWQGLQLLVPTLGEDEIQQHVASILSLSQRLAETCTSSLLLLFPLRVASARVWQASQKQQIMRLFGMVASSFPVAGAFIADIEHLWGCNR